MTDLCCSSLCLAFQLKLCWMLAECVSKSDPANCPQCCCWSVTINTSALMSSAVFVVFLLLQCLWCAPSSRCIDYPVGNIVPPNSLCPLNDARWGVCWGTTNSNKWFFMSHLCKTSQLILRPWGCCLGGTSLYEIKFGLKFYSNHFDKL